MFYPNKNQQCPSCNNTQYNHQLNRHYYDSSWTNTPMYNPNYSVPYYDRTMPYPDDSRFYSDFSYYQPSTNQDYMVLQDYGPAPFALNINDAAKQNPNFRTTIWTGEHLQVTLMSINVGEDIGVEIHPKIDQFIRIEEGQGLVMMGDQEDNLDFQVNVSDDYAFVIPAGKYHNLINTGNIPLKVYSIYAPPQHPHGTVHETKADAMASKRYPKQ